MRQKARRSPPSILADMPVIVIGADTPLGRAAVTALLPGVGELRAFVTNPDDAERLKQQGVKVALGDVSDGSHVGGAALNAFCAVLAVEAAIDDRERSFADSPEAVIAAWAEGLADGGIKRAIWLEHDDVPAEAYRPLAAVVAEAAGIATGTRTPADIASEVARLESQASW